MSSALGVIILAHDNLHRVVQTAKYWIASSCPVVIHVDQKVEVDELQSLYQKLADEPFVRFATRHRCEWGMWGLVEATLSATQTLLDSNSDVQHVMLTSGACLPIKPIDEILGYLHERKDTDFIESVKARAQQWTIDGLNFERFELHFPFSWKKQRYLFDRYVDLQRAFHFRRRIPDGIEPHLGSQWWCLSRKTLSAILNNPDRDSHDRYFRSTWIPDESYFQTMVQKFSTQIENRSLTLNKFDKNGKPYTFYDDHIDMLETSNMFAARKIWPGADKLYDHFLQIPSSPKGHRNIKHRDLEDDCRQALARASQGRAGLYMQSRFPRKEWNAHVSAVPYFVFHGFSDLFQGFDQWIEKTTRVPTYGRLFDKNYVDIGTDTKILPGSLSRSVPLRDYNPKSFLMNLTWSHRESGIGFQYDLNSSQDVLASFSRDKNCRQYVIRGYWAFDLFTKTNDGFPLREHALQYKTREAEMLSILFSDKSLSDVKTWSLSEVLETPGPCLDRLLDDIRPGAQRPKHYPKIQELDAFQSFLKDLKQQGIEV